MLLIFLVIVIQRCVVLVFTTLPLYLTGVLLYVFRVQGQFFMIYRSSSLLIIISKMKFPCALLSTRAINFWLIKVTSTFRYWICCLFIVFISYKSPQDLGPIAWVTSLVTDSVLLYCFLYRLTSYYYNFLISLYYTYQAFFSFSTFFQLLIRLCVSSSCLLVFLLSSFLIQLSYFTRLFFLFSSSNLYFSLGSFRVYR